MIKEQEYSILLKIMRKQVKATECFLINMKKLHKSVLDKDWLALTPALQRQEKLSAILEGLETDRHLSKIALCSERDIDIRSGFQEMCIKLRVDESSALVPLFRKLKKNMLLIQSGIRELEVYTSWKKSMIDEVFNEALPERRGNVYGPSGALVPSGLNPLVVNQTL